MGAFISYQHITICKNLARIGIAVVVFYYTSFLFILLDPYRCCGSTLFAVPHYILMPFYLFIPVNNLLGEFDYEGNRCRERKI
jgi:hypothetical protein